ncbi:hypothetical protein E4T47_01889 [Aureobasidium subglaciale]|nr:hypothetical protein E4T47_01889 [Aureobasidium subglaciale]
MLEMGGLYIVFKVPGVFITALTCKNPLAHYKRLSSGQGCTFDRTLASNFVEVFDDEDNESVPPSPESILSTLSPQHVHNPDDPLPIADMFSVMTLEEGPLEDQKPEEVHEKNLHSLGVEQPCPEAPTEVDIHNESTHEQIIDASHHKPSHTSQDAAISKPADDRIRLLQERNISPEEYQKANEHIEASFGNLALIMNRFEKRRKVTSFLVNACFKMHRESNNTLPKNCPNCLGFLEDQERWYLEACFEIRAVMKELEQHVRDNGTKPELIQEHASGGTRHFNPDGIAFCELNIQRLDIAECMLQTLYVDAELGEGWPRTGKFGDTSHYLSQVKKTEPDEVKNEAPGDPKTSKDGQGNEADETTSHRAHGKKIKSKTKKNRKSKKPKR